MKSKLTYNLHCTHINQNAQFISVCKRFTVDKIENDSLRTKKHETTQVNRMSKSRRVLAIGGKQRSFGLHMVCFEAVLYHNEPH